MLEIITSVISLIGTANTVHDIYKKVYTLFKGDSTEKYLQQITEKLVTKEIQVERLSDDILFLLCQVIL